MVLPLILIVAEVIGMVVAEMTRSRDPQRYARIGHGTAVEQAEHLP